MRIMNIFPGVFFLLGMWTSSCEKNKDQPEEKPDEWIVEKFSAQAVVKTNVSKTYMHFMPWFETKETSDNGKWGIHWTMATKNPDIADTDGKREIASHFYPLTGPYASGDPAILEYQLLLMKYAGVDGVLVDWYGSTNLNDYGSIRANTEKLIDALDAVGLTFAIVYEDRTITEAVAKEASFDRIAGAQTDMIYLKQKYFTRDSYMRLDGKPLLLVFGPEEFHQPEEWTQIMSVFSTPPAFLTLNGKTSETGINSIGEYIWVDQSSLESKYEGKDQFARFMGGAYPGFKDYYGQGGWGSNFSWQIDHNEGETFRENLNQAKAAQVGLVQLITWNDYGEGTMIEPTRELGYTLLEELQDFTGVSYAEPDLKTIAKLYQLRVTFKNEVQVQRKLDQAFYFLVSLQVDKAVALLETITNE